MSMSNVSQLTALVLAKMVSKTGHPQQIRKLRVCEKKMSFARGAWFPTLLRYQVLLAILASIKAVSWLTLTIEL